MALYLSGYADNPMSYPDFGQCWANPPAAYPMPWSIGTFLYNRALVTCPKHYRRSLTQVVAFFYVGPPDDMYVLWGWNNEVYWPSWSIMKWHFDASTGLLKDSDDMGGITYVSNAEIGEFNHVYSTFRSSTDCWQINYQTAASEAACWHIHPYSWNPKRIFSNIIVDRQNDKMLAIQYPYMEIWENVIGGGPSMVFQMRTPYTIKDLAYESNQYAWTITNNAQIYKVNWKDNKRVEMLSSIQTTPSDKGYYIAYDTLRQRLCVFRWMNDAADGAAQNRIEFYETVPKPAFVLDPVPVTRHRSGDYTKFVSKIVGNTGEGFAGGRGQASLVAPNNHGRVLSPSVMSGITGDFNISYQAPETAETDTIKLEVEYQDGLGEIEV